MAKDNEDFVLPQPAHWFRGSYCSYCIHTRSEHGGDEGICLRCLAEGNGFWPECPGFTRTAKTPDEHPGLTHSQELES